MTKMDKLLIVLVFGMYFVFQNLELPCHNILHPAQVLREGPIHWTGASHFTGCPHYLQYTTTQR